MPALAAPVTENASAHTTIVVRADVRTGKLIRSVAAPERPAHLLPAAAPTQNIDEIITRVAGEQGVESPLVHSVIRAESNYNPHALSPKGAQGIMQLIPSTAKRFGVSNAFDAEDNIQGGVRYLRFLLDYFKGDYARAIAAYNAGEGAVDRYRGIPPFAETQNYVYRVAKNLKTARQRDALQSAAPANKQTQLPPAPVTSAPPETSLPIVASTGQDGRTYYRTP